MILTVPERKERECARRSAAAEWIASALAEYGREHGGRFLLFGSGAARSMSHSSDLDVVVDFEAADELAAILYVEDLAASHRLPADIHPLRALRPAFLERIGPGAVPLP